MSTRITVTSDTSALVGRVLEVQQANREAQLERERDMALRAKIENTQPDATDPIGGTPNTQADKRPAAQRESTGIFAAEVSTRYDTATDTFYVKASVPGVSGSVEVATAASGRGSVTVPPSVYDTGRMTAYGRVYKYESGEWAIYRDGSFGGGTNYSDRFAEPPRTSNRTDYNYLVSERKTDESESFLLPLSSTAGILIYLQNRIEVYNKYERAINNVHSSVNERNIRTNPAAPLPYEWGDPGYWADWDAQGHVRFTHTMYEQEVFSAHEILAFFVSDKGVKQIDVPANLETLLWQIYPAVSINGTAGYLDEINYDEYYAHNFSGFVDRTSSNYTTTYQQEPAFSRQAWRRSSRYSGIENDRFFALPRHFGLGYLRSTNHNGPFSTPAIFTFLNGPMALTETTAQSYATMRASYFSSAPFTFYAPCARTGSCQDATITEFDLTRTQPATVTTALPANQFRRNKRTDVVIGSPKGKILYAWDWGNPAGCRRKVLDLGFTAQDLTP
jgi:hypothetical protein